jgi:hypothetical protein
MLADIVACIERQLAGDTDSDSIHRICSDSASVGPCQEIAEDPSESPQIRYNAIRFLYVLIDHFSERWDSDMCASIYEWVLQTLQKDPESLLRADFLISGFAQMFGCLVLHRYSLDESFATFFDSLAPFFEDLSVLCTASLRLLSGVINAFSTSDNTKLRRLALSGSDLHKAMAKSGFVIGKVLSGACEPDARLVGAALRVISDGLGMDVQTSVSMCLCDDVEVFAVSLPVDCTPLFSDPQFAHMLVLVAAEFPNTRRDVLELFYHVLSIRHCDIFKPQTNGRESTILPALYLTYVECFRELAADGSFIHELCLIAYKLNLGLTLGLRKLDPGRNLGLCNYAAYLEFLKELQFPLIRIDFFLQSPETVFYVIKAWTCFAKVFMDLADQMKAFICRTIVELAQCFYEVTVDLFTNHFHEATAIFIIDEKLGFFHEFDEFARMSQIDFTAIAEALLGEFKTRRRQYFSEHSGTSEVCLAILVQIFGVLLLTKPSTWNRELADLEVQIFRKILKLMHQTGDEIEEYLSQGRCYLELTFLGFCQNLRNTNFGSQMVTNLHLLRNIGRPFPSIFQFLFDRCFLLLNSGSRELFQAATKSLSVYFMSVNIELPIEKFIEIEPEIAIGDRVCRDSFLRILYSLLFSERHKKRIPSFFEPISTRFDEQMQLFDSNAFVNLMADLSVFVSVLSRDSDFSPFVRWFIPRRIRMLEDRIPVIVDHPTLLTPVLDFWLNLVSNQGGRIVIEDFSADGIILFKSTAHFIRAFLGIIRQRPDLGWQDYAEQFALTIRIMGEVCQAKWILFDVFRLYSDHCYADLLTEFFAALDTIAFQQIQQYPEVVTALADLIRGLLKSHSQTIIQCRLINDTVRVIIFLMFVPVADLFVRAREALEFLLASESEVEMDARLVEELIKRLFEVICAADEFTVDALAHVMNALLKMRLEYLSRKIGRAHV